MPRWRGAPFGMKLGKCRLAEPGALNWMRASCPLALNQSFVSVEPST